MNILKKYHSGHVVFSIFILLVITFIVIFFYALYTHINKPAAEPAPEVTYSTPQGKVTEITLNDEVAYLYKGRLYWHPPKDVE